MTKERAIEILKDLIKSNKIKAERSGVYKETLDAFQFAIDAIEKVEEQNN